MYPGANIKSRGKKDRAQVFPKELIRFCGEPKDHTFQNNKVCPIRNHPHFWWQSRSYHFIVFLEKIAHHTPSRVHSPTIFWDEWLYTGSIEALDHNVFPVLWRSRFGYKLQSNKVNRTKCQRRRDYQTPVYVLCYWGGTSTTRTIRVTVGIGCMLWWRVNKGFNGSLINACLRFSDFCG